jgi:hypothetical protein
VKRKWRATSRWKAVVVGRRGAGEQGGGVGGEEEEGVYEEEEDGERCDGKGEGV